jgi:L-threonine-O-3-phosphate decarboxylase
VNQPQHGGNLTWAAAIAGCPPSAILDFSASISPLGPPPSGLTAIQSHLNDLRSYPDPNYQQLRSVLGAAHDLPPEWILPGNGAAELLTWAGWDLSTLSGTFLITPAFGDYQRCLRAVNAQAIACPLNLTLPNPLGQPLPLSPQSTHPPRAECGLLLNNPHNPTGQLFSLEAIAPHLGEFPLVVVDEAFMDFLPPEAQQSLIHLLPDHPNLVILRSLTKFYSLPGLRLGYAIAHPDRLQRWQQWRDPWPVNVLAAAAGAAAIRDTDFQQQTWAWLPPARSQLFASLAQLPALHPFPSAANFLLVHCDISASQLQQHLLKRHRILIRDCLSFPELGDRFFRIAIRLPKDNQHLCDALADVLSSSPDHLPPPTPPQPNKP